ncbi:50S ribosomal protein L25 [Guggenheimella bovis]
MNRPQLNAVARKDEKAKDLRHEGLTPASLYGSHIEAQAIAVKSNELERLLKQASTGSTIDLIVDGKKHMALIKEVQADPVRRDVLHIDFQALALDEKTKVMIPIILHLPELKNALVQQLLNEIEIEALPQDLIDNVEYHVPFGEPGFSATLEELKLIENDNITIHTPLDTVVYNIAGVKEFVEPEPGQEEAPEAGAEEE